MTTMTAQKTTREKAIEWMRGNLAAIQMFERFAQELFERNKPLSMHVLSGRVRYEYLYESKPGEYKINQNHSPYIARYLLWKHPQWKSRMKCKLGRYESEVVPVTDADLLIGTA